MFVFVYVFDSVNIYIVEDIFWQCLHICTVRTLYRYHYYINKKHACHNLSDKDACLGYAYHITGLHYNVFIRKLNIHVCCVHFASVFVSYFNIVIVRRSE